MSRCRSIERLCRAVACMATPVLLALVLALPRPGHAAECSSGPITPDNPDNRLQLCSPTPSEVQVRILTNGVELSWDAPPRATSAYVSPIQAIIWQGLDSLATVPGFTLRGDYMSPVDQRIQLDVETIDSLGTTPTSAGFVGRDRVRVRWTSVHRTSAGGSVTGGLFTLPVGYSGALLRFDVPSSTPGAPPDTTALAGLRLRVDPGLAVRAQDAALFDVEDFEGWHVWRWGADPTLVTYESVGEYSKVANTQAPFGAWLNIRPDARRIVFLDDNVFDGFVYHYAITTYDQGFDRVVGGDLGIKFESPISRATPNSGGAPILGPTQILVAYRNEPPAEFEPIAAVPNPFRDSEIIAARPETQFVSFINSPAKGTLYLWTVAGDLVLQRDHEQPTVGTIQWDTTNQAGQRVASGIYIYKIVDFGSGQASYGRLAIIR